MTLRLFLLLAFGLHITFASTSASASEHVWPTKKWLTLSSEHFVITFESEDQATAQDTLNKAEAFLPDLTTFLQWEPEDRIELVLSRQSDQANGYATPIPFSRSVLFDALPTGTNSLQDYNDWMELLVLHELTHIVHIDKARDWSLFPRRIFGRNLFTFSNLFQPNFFKEGLAVYVETSWKRGIGRGQSAYFDMMMRQEVASGLLPLGKAQQRIRDWPLNKDYLYGVYFYQFLDESYGVQSIQDYIHAYSGQLVPFIVDRPVRKHTNKRSLEALWDEFLSWLELRFEPQISIISNSEPNRFEKISDSGYFNSSPYFDDAGNMYFIAFDAYASPQIVMYDTVGQRTALTRTKTSSKIIHADTDTVWYLQHSACGHNASSSDLYRFDLDTGNATRITECQHIIDGAISGHRLAAIQNLRGGLVLSMIELAQPGDLQVEPLHHFPQYHNAGSLVWMTDGALAFTSKAPNSNWNVQSFDIKSGSQSSLFEMPDAHVFDISPGPRDTLIISSDFGGRMELWQIQLSPASAEHRPVALTNSLGGATSGRYDPNRHTLAYRSYGPEGWDIVHTPYPASPAMTPVLTPAKPGDGHEAPYSQSTPHAEVATTKKDYTAIDTVYPRSWFFGFTSDSAQNTGVITLDGRDTLNFHNWALVGGRDFDNALNVFSSRYTAYNHFTALYSREYDYTLGSTSGPAAFVDKPRFIETQERIAGIVHALLPADFSQTLIYSGFAFSENDIQDQSNVNNQRLERTKTTGLGLLFDNREYGLYSISPQWGRTIQAVYEHDRVSLASTALPKQDTRGKVWSIDWREHLTLYQAHTLTLRAMTGRADNGADPFDLSDSPSFSAFDQVMIHRREYPLRAYPDQTPELFGREPQILSAQYDFPIMDVDQGLAGWPFGLYSISGALFYESGKARKNANSFKGFGAEIGSGFDVGFGLLPIQLRLGVAVPEQKTLAAPEKKPNYYLSLGIGL